MNRVGSRRLSHLVCCAFACLIALGTGQIAQAENISVRHALLTALETEFRIGRMGDGDDTQNAYIRACQAGINLACEAKMWRLSNGKSISLEQAQPLFVKACDEGEPVGCLAASWWHGRKYFSEPTGSEVGDNPKRAVELVRRGCDLKLQRSYAARGLSAMGIGTELRKDRALRTLVTACDAGDLAGCTHAGWEHQLVASFQFAARFYRRACDGGNPHGCLRLGHVYAYALGVDIEEKRASELYRKGCDAGYTLACGALAGAYRNSLGVKQN